MKKKITFFGFWLDEASKKSGVPFSTTFRHATGQRRISAEFAVRYHEALGIPLSAMRPDLWPEGKNHKITQ